MPVIKFVGRNNGNHAGYACDDYDVGDPRKSDKIRRFRGGVPGLSFENNNNNITDSTTTTSRRVLGESDYVSILGMFLSMLGFIAKMKLCGWMAILCSCAELASTRPHDDVKYICSSFILSITATVASYYWDPSPMMI